MVGGTGNSPLTGIAEQHYVKVCRCLAKLLTAPASRPWATATSAGGGLNGDLWAHAGSRRSTSGPDTRARLAESTCGYPQSSCTPRRRRMLGQFVPPATEDPRGFFPRCRWCGECTSTLSANSYSRVTSTVAFGSSNRNADKPFRCSAGPSHSAGRPCAIVRLSVCNSSERTIHRCPGIFGERSRVKCSPIPSSDGPIALIMAAATRKHDDDSTFSTKPPQRLSSPGRRSRPTHGDLRRDSSGWASSSAPSRWPSGGLSGASSSLGTRASGASPADPRNAGAGEAPRRSRRLGISPA